MQPDAANFNSWRRHIKLSASPPEEVVFAWEDVKAMFNGGSRKRAMAASLTSVSKMQQQRQQSANQSQARDAMAEHMGGKRARLASSSPDSQSPSSGADASPKAPISGTAAPPYFPLVPLPTKNYPPLAGPSAVGNPFSPNALPPPAAKAPALGVPPQDFRQNFAEFMWAGKQPTLQLPYSCLLWPRPGLGALGDPALRHKMPPFPMSEPVDPALFSHMADKSPFWADRGQVLPEPQRNAATPQPQRISAFKPVGKSNTAVNGKGVESERISNSPPAPSPRSDENEVDVIGGEDDSQASDGGRDAGQASEYATLDGGGCRDTTSAQSSSSRSEV